MEDDFFSILQKSIQKLSNSPILLLAGLAIGILSLPGLAVYGKLDIVIQNLASGFMLVVVPLLLMPFFLGGALGYALELRRNGKASLKTFIDSGIKNYRGLFLAGIIAFVIYYIMMFILLIGMGLFIESPFVGVLMLVASIVLSFLCLMAIEFYDIVIVAEGAGVFQAFSKSVDFVRRNLLAIILFFVIILVVKYLVQVPLMAGVTGEYMTNSTYMNMTSALNSSLFSSSFNASTNSSINPALNSTLNTALSTPISFSGPALALVAILQIVLQTVVFAFVTLFKVEFYETMKSRRKITDIDYDFADEKEPGKP